MQLPPPEVFESWPTPNYDNPEHHDFTSLCVISVVFGWMCIITGIRIYTRLWISKNFGLDDWLILFAFVPTTAFTVISLLLNLAWGWNRHEWDMRLESISFGLKYILAAEFLFTTAASLTKLSMMALVYRVMGGAGRLGFLIKLTSAFTVACWISFGFGLLFQCRPVSDYWKLTFDAQPNCVSEPTVLLVGGIVNTVMDLWVVLLPMPKVWSLQLTRRERTIVVVLFGIGIEITVVGVVRTIYTYQIAHTYDKSWLLYHVFTTAAVELYVGIMCACVPPTKKFFSLYMPILLKSNSNHPTTSIQRTNSTRSDPNHNFIPINSPHGIDREIPIEMDVNHSQLSKHGSYQGHEHAAKTVRFHTATSLFPPHDEEIGVPHVMTGGVGNVNAFDFQFDNIDRKDMLHSKNVGLH